MKYKTFSFFTYEDSDYIREKVVELKNYFISEYSLAFTDLKNAELIIVLGGDGTLISASKLFSQTPKDFFVINTGTNGYLSSLPKDSLETRLIFDFENVNYLEIPILECLLFRNEEIKTFPFINEIHFENLMEWVDISIFSGETQVKNISGSGACIISAIGSTSCLAKHMGCNPLAPDLHAFYVKGINDRIRPGVGVIFSGQNVLKIKIGKLYNNPLIPLEEKSELKMFADGGLISNLEEEDELIFQYTNCIHRVVKPDLEEHWKKLHMLY